MQYTFFIPATQEKVVRDDRERYQDRGVPRD